MHSGKIFQTYCFGRVGCILRFNFAIATTMKRISAKGGNVFNIAFYKIPSLEDIPSAPSGI